MPGAVKYIEDMDSKAAGDLDRLAQEELRIRRRVYERNWRYYRGKHRRWLKRDKSGIDDNVTLNKIKLVIGKGISSLMGVAEQGIVHGPEFQVTQSAVDEYGAEPVETLAPSPEQHMLDLIWQANDKGILLNKLALSAALTGHTFVRLIPIQKINPETGIKELPRIMLLNPSNVVVFWDIADPERVLWYRVEHAFGQPNSRIVKRQDFVHVLNDKTLSLEQSDGTFTYITGDYWVIREIEAEVGIGSGRFRVIKEIVWPYEWAPIIDWPNEPEPGDDSSDEAGVYYGPDEVQELGELNDALNFVASNTQRIIKHHAAPRTVGTGFESKGLVETGVENFWSIGVPDAKVYNVETQSNLAGSLDFLRIIQRAIFDGASELDPQSVQDKLGAMTNFGIRILFRDNLNKMSTKRLVHSSGLRLVSIHGLTLVGIDNVQIDVLWPPPLPTDPVLQVQALAVDTQHGVSDDSYMVQRGYNAAAERAKRKKEQQDKAAAQAELYPQLQPQSQGTNTDTSPNLPASPQSVTASVTATR